MSSLALSCIIFALTLAGIVIGILLRRILPEQHLSKDSREVVRLGVGLVATIAALVLGLLIAAAKGSFDTQSVEVRHITADMILLDNLLEQYGADAAPIRKELRAAIPAFVDRLWQEKEQKSSLTFESSAAAEKVFFEIQSLSPGNDTQRSLQARAVQISTDLAQTRLMLFTEKDNAIPAPFLAVLVIWLVIIFTTFSLFSDVNGTVFVFLSLFAASASCAIFLILELGTPFIGLMMISSEPLRNALPPLVQ